MDHTKNAGRFKLSSGLYIDVNVLEQMRASLLAFVQGPDFPAELGQYREPMQAELQVSRVWIDEHGAWKGGIGVWKLTEEKGRPALVRHPPPRRGTAFIYHAILDQDASGWHVVAFEQEKELGPA